MVVVSASLLVDALLIDGPARARLADANLQAPDLIDAELLSVLRRLVIAGRLPEQHALRALITSQQLGLRRHVSRHLSPRAWELRTNLTAYDALYDARTARAPGLLCTVEVMTLLMRPEAH